LAQPAETARGPHLVGDQIGHLVDVAGVYRGELFHLGHAFGMGQPWPRAVVESPSRAGDGGVDILRAGHLDMAERLFGVRRDDGELLGVGGLAPLPSDEQFVIGAMVGLFCHRGTSSSGRDHRRG
jgi:hypothetical protein